MHLRTLLPTATAVAVIVAFATGCGSSSSPTASTTPATNAVASASAGLIEGRIDEWSVRVSKASASAGKVTFRVRNAGKATHESVVLRTGKPADGLGGGNRVSESGNVGETGDIAAGATKSVTLDLKPGHYALVCNLPGHYKLGMHADFTVN